MQQTIAIHYKRIMNFMGFARNFILRKNPIKAFVNDCIAMIKDVFSIKQKQKMAKYRLNYQIHRLHQMETLIAQNNEHNFLKGAKFNEMR